MSEATPIEGQCEVHGYALNDWKVRDVYYCSICDAWICHECMPNIPRRALAMVKKAKAKISNRNQKRFA